MKNLIFAIILIVFSGGCATGPQYIPETLQTEPAENLSKVLIDHTVKSIDGINIKSNNVFILPGKHQLKYLRTKLTDIWVSMHNSRKSEGDIRIENEDKNDRYSSATWISRDGTKLRIGNMPMFEWKPSTLTFTAKKGEVYLSSKLIYAKNGLVFIDRNYIPSREIVSYRKEGKTVLQDKVFKLIEHKQGLAMYMFDNVSGKGMLYTTHWVDEKGDHFSKTINDIATWEYVIPVDRSKNACAYFYKAGTFTTEMVNGIEIPVPYTNLKPTTILVPR